MEAKVDIAPGTHRIAWVVAALAVVSVLSKAVALNHDPVAALAASDADDIMRLLSVRDWLAGQSWYDTRQAGVAVEGGLTLHWSRLVDLGIAAIIWPLSLIIPMERAEAAGLVLWPLLLMAVLILVTVRESLRQFGPYAAMGAAICLLISPLFVSYFSPGRIDHHNVQILLLTVAVFALLRPDDGWRSGAVAGLATAFSLAVGLEMLWALAIVGAILGLRLLLRPEASANGLLGYACVLVPASFILFAVQTAPSQWNARYCDQLALPLLSAISAAAAAAVVLAVLSRRLRSVLHRAAAFALVTPIFFAPVLPILLPCTSGPYGELPPAVQDAIYTQIKEATSALMIFEQAPSVFHVTIMPLAISVVIASLLWVLDRDTSRRNKVGILLIFGWIAGLGTLHQVRMILPGAVVMPMLVGYILVRTLEVSSAGWHRIPAGIAAVVLGLISVVYPYAYLEAATLRAPATASKQQNDASTEFYYQCRTEEVLQKLRTLPHGVVLSSMNLGPSILLSAGHQILSAPYHRSPTAITNGFAPFIQDGNAFLATVDEVGADYVVLCRNEFRTGFAGKLSQGVPMTGLELLPELDRAMIVYRVPK